MRELKVGRIYNIHMSNKQRIKYLFNQCIQHQETVAERNELNQYITDPTFKELVEACMLEAFYLKKKEETLSSDSKEQILNAIYASADEIIRPSFKARLWQWASVAAVFLMITVPLVIKTDLHEKFAELTFLEDKRNVPNESISSENEILPAQESATLEMVDGTKLYLPTLAIGTQITKNGLVVQKSAQNELLLKYDLNHLNKQMKNANYVIKTPKGGKYKLTLPDGTLVHLNSASTLLFPYLLTDSLRYVELIGEAYFEVVKDKRQFVVYSKQGKLRQEVKVYGTSFNVNAYPDADGFETTLVQGSVHVTNLNNQNILWLNPNEQVVLGADGMVKSKADLDRNLAWLNNIFYFEDETLENALKQISRWYDVDFKNIPGNLDQKLWAQVSRNISLVELLTIIEKTYAIKFEIRGKEVYIVN